MIGIPRFLVRGNTRSTVSPNEGSTQLRYGPATAFAKR